jgi:hypothetical protein
MAEKSRPRYLDLPLTDVFIKWMSRINTFFYRRGGGEGLGSTFQNISGRPADHDRPQVRATAGVSAVFPARR